MRFSKIYPVVFVLAGLMFLSILPVKRVFSRSAAVLGTFATIHIVSSDRTKADQACFEAFEAIRAMGKRMNRYDPGSIISKLNNADAGTNVAVGPEVYGVIEYACKLADMTGGALDITVLPLLLVWKEAEEEKTLPPKARIRENPEGG